MESVCVRATQDQSDTSRTVDGDEWKEGLRIGRRIVVTERSFVCSLYYVLLTWHMHPVCSYPPRSLLSAYRFWNMNVMVAFPGAHSIGHLWYLPSRADQCLPTVLSPDSASRRFHHFCQLRIGLRAAGCAADSRKYARHPIKHPDELTGK